MFCRRRCVRNQRGTVVSLGGSGGPTSIAFAYSSQSGEPVLDGRARRDQGRAEGLTRRCGGSTQPASLSRGGEHGSGRRFANWGSLGGAQATCLSTKQRGGRSSRSWPRDQPYSAQSCRTKAFSWASLWPMTVTRDSFFGPELLLKKQVRGPLRRLSTLKGVIIEYRIGYVQSLSKPYGVSV